MKKKGKRILLLLIMGMLFLPLLQFSFSFAFIKELPLKGSFVLTEKPEPTFKKWISGTYQEGYSNYFNDHIGFRNFFVRGHNQIQYSFFEKSNVNDIVIGRDGYLFEGSYLREYMGDNFLGKEKITKKLKEVKKIQAELEENNISLIVVFAPGKASYFPEYFPQSYDTSQRTLSNYQFYSKKCQDLNIDNIDINSYFIKHKQHSEYKLFPQGGIHWGEYGLALAIDSLVKHIQYRRDIRMQIFDFKKIEYLDSIEEKDKDISDGMNLLFEYSSYKMPQPRYIFKKTKNKVKPKLLIIGDSFGSRMKYSSLMDSLFSYSEIWYYNNGIEPPRKNHSNRVKDINTKEELKRFDVVLLIATEANLNKFDFGFSDNYNNSSYEKYNSDVQYYMKRISSDEDWMKLIKEKAFRLKITIDSSISIDAHEWASKRNNYKNLK
jgi:hypothetical protein